MTHYQKNHGLRNAPGKLSICAHQYFFALVLSPISCIKLCWQVVHSERGKFLQINADILINANQEFVLTWNPQFWKEFLNELCKRNLYLSFLFLLWFEPSDPPGD